MRMFGCRDPRQLEPSVRVDAARFLERRASVFDCPEHVRHRLDRRIAPILKPIRDASSTRISA
jgi:hypothetical protein